MRKYTMDMTDFIGGIGIGLCFSSYCKIGVLLIGISFIVAGIQKGKRDNEQKRKKTK